eukprot:m.512160 g.512160  ORF g.512160 m.512160 type:complete len:106 (+) comp57434_c0_seq47:369-686(+)
MVKYGVMSAAHALEDLQHWSTLYLSGRLHKQVCVLRDDDEISQAVAVNRDHAVTVALLTLPARFSEREFYAKIAGLSYSGDLRMAVGESPGKARENIFFRLFSLN